MLLVVVVVVPRVGVFGDCNAQGRVVGGALSVSDVIF